MQVEEFLKTMAAMSADQKIAIAMCLDDLESGSHVDWLEKWHLYRDHGCHLPENFPIANKLCDKVNQLSVQLATTPAVTSKDTRHRLNDSKRIWAVTSLAMPPQPMI